jgi:cytoskeletal protein CcmA (bactofilin family)
MLNKKSKPNTVNGSSQKSPSLNMISEGTHIKGTIRSENDIRIAGKLEGEAICKGKVLVNSTAHIEAGITSAEADIAGTVDGTIRVSDKLTLRQTARVSGDIYTKTLIVEEGGQFNGNCRMGSEAVELNGKEDADFSKSTVVTKKEE